MKALTPLNTSTIYIFIKPWKKKKISIKSISTEVLFKIEQRFTCRPPGGTGCPPVSPGGTRCLGVMSSPAHPVMRRPPWGWLEGGEGGQWGAAGPGVGGEERGGLGGFFITCTNVCHTKLPTPTYSIFRRDEL